MVFNSVMIDARCLVVRSYSFFPRLSRAARISGPREDKLPACLKRSWLSSSFAEARLTGSTTRHLSRKS
ncbi:unnamed protein product [Schistosoma margrebowiei]|uniref:Uncharacterized protein n=1 Tax=Schistosoma margrebowiei TaxID=48269 RepID=A0A183LI11_9TREM|nr:unnamed protein product [Schistosoma margrebowiei]